MLRLLTNLASDSEAQRVSALMREDPAIAMQCRRLIEITRKRVSVRHAFDDGDEVAADWSAGFIDGTLSDAEQEQFEQKCWNSEGLLREVVSLWRMEFDPRPDRDLSPDQSRLCLLPIEIQELLGETHPKMGDFVSEATDQSTESLTNGPKIRINVAPIADRTTRRPSWFLIGSIAAAAIAVIGMIRWMNSGQEDAKGLVPERIAQDDTGSDTPSMSDPGMTLPRIDQVVEQNPPESAVQQSIEPIPDRSPAIDRKDDSGDLIVRTPMQESSEPPEGRTPSLSPKTESTQTSPVVNFAEWFEWTESRGVAAVRDETRDQWRGFLASPSYPTEATSRWVQVVTFNDSLLSGNARDELRWTADANTTFTLSQGANETQPVVICQLERGRLAVENLTENQRLEFQLNNRTHVIDVNQVNTSLVVQRIEQRLLVGLHRGLISVGDQAVSRSAWIAIDPNGKTEKLRPLFGDQWYREKKRDQMPKDLTAAFNHAPQFLAQLNDLAHSANLNEQLFATNALLSCRAAEQIPPDDETLLAMINSSQERVRESLIKWLHQQCVAKPRLGMSVTKKLAAMQNLPPAERQNFEEWFASAARSLSYNDRLLNQLKNSLSNQSRPLVRQAAKYFLQRFLNETLEFYSAINPGAANGRVVTEVQRRVTQKQRLLKP